MNSSLFLYFTYIHTHANPKCITKYQGMLTFCKMLCNNMQVLRRGEGMRLWHFVRWESLEETEEAWEHTIWGKCINPHQREYQKHLDSFCPCESSVECGVFLSKGQRQVDNGQGWASEFSDRGLANRFPEVSMATVAGIFRCKMVWYWAIYYWPIRNQNTWL